MSPLDWFKKEMPFQGLTGFGGGAASLLQSGAGLTEVDATDITEEQIIPRPRQCL